MIPREKGSVTIDNNQYGGYAGELQITLTDLPANEKVNVVGRMVEEDLPPCVCWRGTALSS